MHWIAPSGKDSATDTLEKRLFVSSARFVAGHKQNPSAELSIHGVEKTDETGRLCRLNLAVHGLEGDIRHGGQVNSYYDDPHQACHPLPSDGRGAGGEGGRFDFVLANPPFNVNAVDKERLKDYRDIPGLCRAATLKEIEAQGWSLNPGRYVSDEDFKEQPETLNEELEDELMENSQRHIRILEAMARALYREWFVHFRFPGSRALASAKADGHESHPRIASPLGHILEGWEVKKLDQLTEIEGGKQLEKENIHEIAGSAVFGGNDIQGCSEKATHEGFVIAFGRVGAYCGSIRWSYGGVWLNTNSSSVVPLKYDESVLHHLLEFNFTSLRSGAAQPFISHTALSGIELVFPHDALAAKFCSLVKLLRAQQVTLERQIQNLGRTRDLLLPRLLSRQVEVETH